MVVGAGCGDARPLNVSYTVSDAQHVLDFDSRSIWLSSPFRSLAANLKCSGRRRCAGRRTPQ